MASSAKPPSVRAATMSNSFCKREANCCKNGQIVVSYHNAKFHAKGNHSKSCDRWLDARQFAVSPRPSHESTG